MLRLAGVAKSVDARDLKSLGRRLPCRFESGPRHCPALTMVPLLAAHPTAVTVAAGEQGRHHPAAQRRPPRPCARPGASPLRHHAEPERLAPGTVEDQMPSQDPQDEDAPEG